MVRGKKEKPHRAVMQDAVSGGRRGTKIRPKILASSGRKAFMRRTSLKNTLAQYCFFVNIFHKKKTSRIQLYATGLCAML